MDDFDFSMDVPQAFNFTKTTQAPVGFITTMTVGDLVLEPDLTSLKNPEQPGEDIASGVVGVLEYCNWNTKTVGSVELVGHISAKNRSALAAKVWTDLTNVKVEFQCVCYGYDDDVEPAKYYKAFWSDAALKGLLEKKNDKLQLTLEKEKYTEVQSPALHRLGIKIKPQPVVQPIQLATADTVNISKDWGSKS